MSLYVVAYDIRHSGRRRRVAKALRIYGDRLQKSVFEAALEPEDIQELCRRVGPMLGKNDAFAILPLDDRLDRPRLHWQSTPRRFGPVTLL